MNNNRLYIVHPLETADNIEENREDEQRIARFLRKNTDFELVRPFRMIPKDRPRDEAMEMCVELLGSCDNVILTGDWENSAGCQYEIERFGNQKVYELKDGKVNLVHKDNLVFGRYEE